MKITLLSPYHGGSHKSWAEGYQQASRHDITLLTMPDRFWKWRMHGGAVTLARRFLTQTNPTDLLFVTDMLDLTTFLALTREKTAVIPIVLYMHENQLTYPLPPNGKSGPMRRQKGERDLHYAFINYASMLAADQIIFNSSYHQRSFLSELPKFLRHFPEFNELNTVPKVTAKSVVQPVGINFGRLHQESPASIDMTKPPLLVWNQRWEYDKNPETFFAALYTLAEEGFSFQVALCGQQYGKRPSVFDEALERLGDRIIHIGYANTEQYRKLLWQAELTLSTAHHEFFGISVLEALYCHTFPILPRDLSYPELLPETYHHHCLYDNYGGLLERLRLRLTERRQTARLAQELAAITAVYDWKRVAPQYDQLLADSASHKN